MMTWARRITQRTNVEAAPCNYRWRTERGIGAVVFEAVANHPSSIVLADSKFHDLATGPDRGFATGSPGRRFAINAASIARSDTSPRDAVRRAVASLVDEDALLQSIEESGPKTDDLRPKASVRWRWTRSFAFPASPECHACKVLDQLTCTTIHGFAQALIKPYPAEARIDPGAEIIDPAEPDLAFQELYEAWLKERLRDEMDDGIVAALVLADKAGGLGFIEGSRNS
jgi:hypothetical protein